VYVDLVDDEPLPRGTAVELMKFKQSRLDDPHLGTYGCRGAHWTLEAEQLPAGDRQGRIVRVFEERWPAKKLLVDNRAGK
jgi:hypothetical protein